MKIKMAGIYRKSGFRDPVFLFAVLVFYFAVMPTQAHAYLDPGTGSFIFQILVGAVVGGIFYFKNFIASLKEKIDRLLGRKPTADPACQTAKNDNPAGTSSAAADSQANRSNKTAGNQEKQP